MNPPLWSRAWFRRLFGAVVPLGVVYSVSLGFVLEGAFGFPRILAGLVCFAVNYAIVWAWLL